MGRGYKGAWALVAPEYVPRPLLAVPIHYYRVPPAEWKHWHADAAPHWVPVYGRRWEDRHQAGHEEHREMRRGEGRREEVHEQLSARRASSATPHPGARPRR